MFPVVPSDSSVSSLSLDGLSIRADEHRGHHSERAIACITFMTSSLPIKITIDRLTLRNDIGLDITVVVLAGPHETTLGFEHLSDHVIDETVLVGNAELLELGFVLSGK